MFSFSATILGWLHFSSFILSIFLPLLIFPSLFSFPFTQVLLQCVFLPGLYVCKRLRELCGSWGCRKPHRVGVMLGRRGLLRKTLPRTLQACLCVLRGVHEWHGANSKLPGDFKWKSYGKIGLLVLSTPSHREPGRDPPQALREGGVESECRRVTNNLTQREAPAARSAPH